MVSTPIGNLEDVTLRALRILGKVRRIACEDTRRTRTLLRHHGIHAAVVPYHRFNEARMLPRLVSQLLNGEDLALVTDGGTPCLSDPGFILVRAAAEGGIPVVPIPGPSALLAALVGAGLPLQRFTFIGFLPSRRGERRRFLETLRDRGETLVFFESPRRLAASLEDMARVFGERRSAICREMTKVHEEFRRARLGEHASRIREEGVKGEVTVVVEGASPDRPREGEPVDLRREVEEGMRRTGQSRRDVIRTLARERGLPRRLVYQAAKGLPSPSASEGNEESE